MCLLPSLITLLLTLLSLWSDRAGAARRSEAPADVRGAWVSRPPL